MGDALSIIKNISKLSGNSHSPSPAPATTTTTSTTTPMKSQLHGRFGTGESEAVTYKGILEIAPNFVLAGTRMKFFFHQMQGWLFQVMFTLKQMVCNTWTWLRKHANSGEKKKENQSKLNETLQFLLMCAEKEFFFCIIIIFSLESFHFISFQSFKTSLESGDLKETRLKIACMSTCRFPFNDIHSSFDILISFHRLNSIDWFGNQI